MTPKFLQRSRMLRTDAMEIDRKLTPSGRAEDVGLVVIAGVVCGGVDGMSIPSKTIWWVSMV